MGRRSTTGGVTAKGQRRIQFEFKFEGARYRPTLLDLTKALARACAERAAEKVALLEQLEEERLRFTLRLESLQKKLRGSKPVTLLHPS